MVCLAENPSLSDFAAGIEGATGDNKYSPHKDLGSIARQTRLSTSIEPIAMYDHGVSGMYYYHCNHLYSVAAITDATGAVVERYGYDAYGESVVTDAAGTPLAGNESSVGNPYRFTGRRLDDETGLMYFRARYYSGGLGRFVGRDPLGYIDGLILYMAMYVPNALDPTGGKVETRELACGACEWRECLRNCSNAGVGFFVTCSEWSP
jgi:RHS repeat-associated protein